MHTDTHQSKSSAGPRPHLSPEQHELLKAALGMRVPDDCAIEDPRAAIREIVNACGPLEQPERNLIAFKNSLNEVANTTRMPFGPERKKKLTGLVSAFIEEMYASAPVLRDGACRGK